MSWKLRVLVSAILLTPAVALALGLGEIRLNSALNQPLSAEIDLVAATPEELGALQAQLASRELFQRYGLDRPAYLDTLEFSVGRGQDGRSVLLVRSRDAIAEPFVSFLMDVSWPRGRLLREYTVLLDPPVFAPQGDEAVPVAIEAPRAESPPAQVAATPAAAPAAEAGSEPAAVPGLAAESPSAQSPTAYRVERGDTLYEIARSLAAGDRSTTQRMMIGLFRANPAAFQGNINVLRAGAVLRVPTADELSAIGAGEAATEVSRQVTDWRTSGGGAGDRGRLRLVTPTEGVADTGTGEPVAGGSVESQVDALEREIQEQRRLLEIKNQELAELQSKLAQAKAPEAAVPAEPEQPAPDETVVAPEDDTGVVVPPAGEAKEPTAAAKPKPKPKPAPEAEGPSFLDSLTDNWLFLLGAAALVLIGGLGYGYVRRRREQDVDDALKRFDVPADAPVPTETMRLRALALGERETEEPGRKDEADIVVEERARPIERPIERPKQEAAPAVNLDETISTEAVLDLDQADPLAEADFHMAYGLYDQACDLVKMALKQSPGRSDLKLKLAEIHFVAGNAQAFLAVAQDLRKSIGSGADWDRVVIMGRQLAPDEALFAGGVQSATVDVSLEGGQDRVDFDLLSAPGGEEGIDLDLGQMLAASDSHAITGEREVPDFNLDEGPKVLGTTQQIFPREGPGTVEMPTLELPSAEIPTVETPALRVRDNDTVRERVSGKDFSADMSADVTAEMAIDDLGIDVGDFEGLSDSQDDATAQPTQADETMSEAPQEESTRVMPIAAARTDATGISRMSDLDRTALMARLEANDVPGIDLDLGSASDDADALAAAATRLSSEQLPKLPELEPVTMSEVGTKLDLARAYMDMGDPDGARNILQEVLAEGSASQKQEARRLIDSLPGA
jgi:pilus assembly protein FimV